MKRNRESKLYSILFLVFSVFILYSCASTNAIDDFFGIKMHPLDEPSFKIISYTPEKGVSYLSNRKMDNRISAWAEVNVNTIKVKVVNNSDSKIPLNYNVDEYVLLTDENSFYLEKGDRQKYFDKSQIEPNSSFEITLELPADYWKTMGSSVNYTDQAKLTKDILKGYAKTGTKLNVVKENIKYILIKFGHTATIVLKPIPEKPKM